MKKITLILCLIMATVSLTITAQNRESKYESWEDTYVRDIYTEIDNEEDADLEEDGRFFETANLTPGVYEVTVIEKLDSRFWKLKGVNLFLEFASHPALVRHDEGILEWYGSRGTFFKKP